MTTIDAVMLFNIAVLPGQQGRNSRPCRNIMGDHPQNAKYIIQDNISQYDRLKQTRLYYDLKDNRDSEHTRFLVKKPLVKPGADLKNTDPIKLGVGWWIEAPNIYDPAQYPDFDCSIIVADYSEATRDQVSDVLEILYPTGHKVWKNLCCKRCMVRYPDRSVGQNHAYHALQFYPTEEDVGVINASGEN